MREEEQLLKRLTDLDNLAQKRQMVCYSDFLNMSEYSSYLQHKREFVSYTSTFSEIANLERQMIAFIPDALIFNEEYPIACLKIVPKNKKFAQEFSHRDVLGVLMSLGLERKLIGDIFIKDSEACFLVHQKMIDYLMDEFRQIRRTEVYLELVEQLPECFKPEFEQHRCNVASLRLDCIVAEMAHCSRSVSDKYIKQGMVFVNGKEVLQGASNCKTEDVVSIRGVGKFILGDVLGKTKKDKIVLTFMKYV